LHDFRNQLVLQATSLQVDSKNIVFDIDEPTSGQKLVHPFLKILSEPTSGQKLVHRFFGILGEPTSGQKLVHRFFGILGEPASVQKWVHNSSVKLG
jgi:hypothetical protein